MPSMHSEKPFRHTAVTAGPTTDRNSGPVEGAAKRINVLERQVFGRAGFDLLRKRVLLAD